MPTKTCHRCGTVLHQDDPGGLCPRCLVQVGIELSAAHGDACDDPLGLESRRPTAAAKPDLAGPSLVGQHFGDYELLEQIARGGMGVVYKARQKSLDRIVALKLLLVGPHAPPESVRRFRAEAVATAALQHPHIVAIHDVGSWASHHFLVMEFVEGRSLARVIPDLQLRISDVRRAAGWVKTVAEAIHYAHERGILHRDLKPSNVLIDARGQPRVTDFGLAKRLAGDFPTTPDPQLTLTGQVLGSPNYIPPEQASGRWGALSRRSDVYALGAVLYQTLTGRPPFVGEGLAEIMQQVLNVDPIPPRMLNPVVPADLETVCLKCLEKEPAKRYPTAQMLADELGRFIEGAPVLARPVGRWAKTWRWCRRNPRLSAATATALVSLVAGLMGVTWQWRRAEAQRVRAEAGIKLALQRGYVGDMNLAQQALAANNLDRVLDLLARHQPAGRSEISNLQSQIQPDLRGWEWRYLWQQTRNEADWVLGSLPGGIRDLAVSSDGRLLAAASEFGTVRVWDLASRAADDVVGNGGTQSFLAFSPDARWLLFTDQRLDRPGTIGVWDTRSRHRTDPWLDPHFIGPMGFSRDGRWFVFGVLGPDRRGRLKVQDFATRKQVGEYASPTPLRGAHNGYGFAFIPGGEQLIVPDSNGRIKRWDFLAGSETEFVDAHPEGVTALALSPDGRTLATGSSFPGSVIRLWEVRTPPAKPWLRDLGSLTNHQDWITDLQFSADGQILASASGDRTIRLWDTATWAEKRVLRGHRHEVWRLCFSHDGQRILSGGRDGTVYGWPIQAPQADPVHWTVPTDLSDLALAPSTHQFAGLQSGAVYLGNTEGLPPVRRLEPLGTDNTVLLFSGDGRFLFAGTQAGEVQVWSLSQEVKLRTLRGPGEPIRQLHRDHSSRFLLALHRNRELMVEGPCSLQVWNVATWEPQTPWTHPRLPPACALSPDGRRLATGHYSGHVVVWELKSAWRTNAPQTKNLTFAGRISGLTFSPDGRFLVASSREGSVKIWDASTLRELTVIRAHAQPINALAFSPDSRRLATASEGEEAIRLWDAATWQPLSTLARTGADLTRLAFTLDGDGIVAVDCQEKKEAVAIWRVPSFAEIDALEQEETTH